jgi:hypothetical protein
MDWPASLKAGIPEVGLAPFIRRRPTTACSGRFAPLTLNRLCSLEISVPLRKSVPGEMQLMHIGWAKYGVTKKCNKKEAVMHKRYIRIITLMISIIATSCQRAKVDMSGRPACVMLENYGYVISQVMNKEPTWELENSNGKRGKEYIWRVESEKGKHELKATLNADGCVCATNTQSDYENGYEEGELAGYFQGAAAAPISELDYLSDWLEPKITWNCSFAFLFRTEYYDEKVMDDGTIWKFSCSRSGEKIETYSKINLEIISDKCNR